MGEQNGRYPENHNWKSDSLGLEYCLSGLWQSYLKMRKSIYVFQERVCKYLARARN